MERCGDKHKAGVWRPEKVLAYRLQSAGFPGTLSPEKSTTLKGDFRMAFSLYDASVGNYLQILGAVGSFLDKSLAHFREKGIDPAEIVETRLAPDMLPFRFQIVSVAHHSRGAMEAAKNGVFVPPSGKPDLDFAALQALVTQARDELSALTPEAVNALVGRDVIFKMGERSMPFTAEGFLMSFSLPNFYFHATTSYDILRHKGAPLGKRDFMGRLKLKA
jgi:uncharacterized protein